MCIGERCVYKRELCASERLLSLPAIVMVDEDDVLL